MKNKRQENPEKINMALAAFKKATEGQWKPKAEESDNVMRPPKVYHDDWEDGHRPYRPRPGRRIRITIDIDYPGYGEDLICKCAG